MNAAEDSMHAHNDPCRIGRISPAPLLDWIQRCQTGLDTSLTDRPRRKRPRLPG